MTIASINAAILQEARTVTKRPKLRIKDIQEWSNIEEEVRQNLLKDTEDFFELPDLGIYIAVLKK